MTTKTAFRIGQIVPSSNTTMETEIPAMLRLREQVRPERFTFHSARMRMKHVNKEELAAMDAESDCRGYYPTDARMLAGCVARDVYQDILESRGICNKGPFIEEDNWVKCE